MSRRKEASALPDQRCVEVNAAPPVRIAMWSGPRNISTALMRSFGNRVDTAVSDEPFYACYLAATGREHPGREEILNVHESDWRAVVRELTGPVPGARAIWYQKHMSHHLLPQMDREWLLTPGFRIALLVRTPAEMLASLARVLPAPALEDTGLPQQVALFEWLRERTGQPPPVIDARDVLEQPRAMLASLCSMLGIPFTDAMLSWPAGPRDTDGVWARHWYETVERSTGFAPYRPAEMRLAASLRPLLAECERLYAQLARERLRV